MFYKKNLNPKYIKIYLFIFFLLLFFAFHFNLKAFYLTTIRKNSPILIKHNELLNSSEYINYLFLGNSIVNNNINTTYLKDSYDFSSKDDNYLLMYYKMQWWLNNKNKPDIVFLPLNIDSFVTDTNLRNLENTYYWDLYINKGNMFLNSFTTLNGKSVHSTFSDTLHLFFSYRNIFNLNTLSNINTKKQNNIPLNSSLLDKKQLHYFKKIINLNNDNSIKTVFIKYPISKNHKSDLISLYSPSILRDYEKNIDKLITSCIQDCTILDYRFKYSLDNLYFKDYYYLNNEGIEIFSKELLNFIK